MPKTSGTKLNVTAIPGIDKLQPHILSDTVPGEMDEAEADALRASVKENGVRQAIVLYEGKILDGRMRYAAAKKAALDLKKVPFVLFEGSAEQAAALVLDNNLHRKKLSSMQKAMVAARMCLRPENKLTQDKAVAMVGVSKRDVSLCIRLIESKNTPLIRRTEKGEATRFELDEALDDGRDRNQTAKVKAVVEDNDVELPTDEEADALFAGLQKQGTAPKTNVVSIATKRSIVGHRASETPASRAIAMLKGEKVQQRSFFEMAAMIPEMRAAMEAAIIKADMQRKAGQKPKPTLKPTGKAKAKVTKRKAA